jgi:ferric-dicitrate binding protein FerR (iron transport regulator)
MKANDLNILIHKKLSNVISENEIQLLDNEVNTNPESAKALEDLTIVWEQTANLPEKVTFDSKVAFAKFKAKINTEQSILNPVEKTAEVSTTENVVSINKKSYFLRYAMSIASMFVLGFFAFKFLNNSSVTTIDPQNFVQIVNLPDESVVTLSPNSSLSYDNKTFVKKRSISLNGKAMFKVAKTGSEFIVKGSSFDVNVLGTTFIVNTSREEKIVKVLEGKVSVSNDKNKNIIITDKEGVNISNEDILKIDEVDFSSDSFISNDMVYNNEKLSKVIADIEAKFGVKIKTKANRTLEGCTFTSASLKNSSLEEILALIEATFNTKIVLKADKEYILGVFVCK